jgi:hypothetical protein
MSDQSRTHYNAGTDKFNVFPIEIPTGPRIMDNNDYVDTLQLRAQRNRKMIELIQTTTEENEQLHANIYSLKLRIREMERDLEELNKMWSHLKEKKAKAVRSAKKTFVCLECGRRPKSSSMLMTTPSSISTCSVVGWSGSNHNTETIHVSSTVPLQHKSNLGLDVTNTGGDVTN